MIDSRQNKSWKHIVQVVQNMSFVIDFYLAQIKKKEKLNYLFVFF